SSSARWRVCRCGFFGQGRKCLSGVKSSSWLSIGSPRSCAGLAPLQVGDPIEEAHVRQRQRLGSKEHHRPQAIGVVGRSRETVPRLGNRCQADAGNEAQLSQTARVQQILDQQVSRLVHVRMQYEVFALGNRETSAYRAPCLHQKDQLALIAQRSYPEAHPVRRRATLDALAYHSVWWPPKESLGPVKLLRFPAEPTSGQRCGDIGERTDQDHIERICRCHTVWPRGAAGQLFKRRTEGVGLAIFDRWCFGTA